MQAKISPLALQDWVPLGTALRSPARREPANRGKRSVAELGVPSGGGERVVAQRDGHFRPEDGSAEYLTFWVATSNGWSQIGSYKWTDEARAWEPVERSGPRPT